MFYRGDLEGPLLSRTPLKIFRGIHKGAEPSCGGRPADCVRWGDQITFPPLCHSRVWNPQRPVFKVPLTEIAIKAFQNQLTISGPGPFLFPSENRPGSYQKTFKTVWHATLRRAGVSCFRIYDLRSTYATRLSAGGVADEFVTQLLRQGDAKVFKKYS
jgi:integrase